MASLLMCRRSLRTAVVASRVVAAAKESAGPWRSYRAAFPLGETFVIDLST